jgi:hypothetical protein
LSGKEKIVNFNIDINSVDSSTGGNAQGYSLSRFSKNTGFIKINSITYARRNLQRRLHILAPLALASKPQQT